MEVDPSSIFIINHFESYLICLFFFFDILDEKFVTPLHQACIYVTGTIFSFGRIEYLLSNVEYQIWETGML